MPPLHRFVFVVALSIAALAPPAGGTDPVDLVELFARAREFDPIYLGARYQRDLAQLGVKESKAGLLPFLNASAQGSRTSQNIKDSDSELFTVGRTAFYSHQYSISLTQPIYRAETVARLPQARAEVRQAMLRYRDTEQALVVRVVEAHFGYLAALDGQELATAELRAIERQLQESEERLASGLGTIADVHEARARHALAQVTEIAAQSRLDESRQALAEIVGEPPAQLRRLSEVIPLVGPDQTDVEVWVEAALFQNPGLKALEAAAEIAEREIQVQRAGRKPTFDFVASYVGRDSGGTEFGGGNEIATTDVSLRVNIPIFDGGRNTAFTGSASLQHRIALQRLELEKRRVERETRASFLGVINGISRVEALRQSVFSHEAALAVREESLRAGLVTGVDVLDARRALFSARRDLAQARYDYLLDSLRLKRAAGILSGDDLEQVNAFLQ